jgi:hypothetical protein
MFATNFSIQTHVFYVLCAGHHPDSIFHHSILCFSTSSIGCLRQGFIFKSMAISRKNYVIGSQSSAMSWSLAFDGACNVHLLEQSALLSVCIEIREFEPRDKSYSEITLFVTDRSRDAPYPYKGCFEALSSPNVHD